MPDSDYYSFSTHPFQNETLPCYLNIFIRTDFPFNNEWIRNYLRYIFKIYLKILVTLTIKILFGLIFVIHFFSLIHLWFLKSTKNHHNF